MNNKIVIVIIIILIGVGAWWFFNKNQNNTPTEISNQTEVNSSADSTVDKQEVIIKNLAFTAKNLIVKVNATVTWTNQDLTAHTVESTAFKSEKLNQGDKFSFTFDTVGSFDYICGLHPNMQGKIIVQP